MTPQTSSAVTIRASAPPLHEDAKAASTAPLKLIQRTDASHPENRPAEEERVTQEPKQLMEAVRLGDRGAFEQLMGALWGGTVRYAQQLTGDLDHAQDVAQVAFTRLWEVRTTIASSASVRVWLLRTTRNLVVNDHRRTQTSSRWATREADLPKTRPRTPLEETERHELRSAITEAVDSLSPRRKESFTLCHLEGLSYREAAEIMGIRPQSVANYLQAALSELRVALAPFYQPKVSALRRDPERGRADRP